MKNILVNLFVVCIFHASSCFATVQVVYAPDLFHEGGNAENSLAKIETKYLLSDKLAILKQEMTDQRLNLDNASTFYTVAFCMDMWNQTLEAMHRDKRLSNPIIDNWNGRSKLTINTRISNVKGDNAFYSPQTRSLNFTYPESSTRGNYMCRSFSTVAHETGHAFLDAVIPGLDPNSEYASALHEAFGDISAILASMRLAILAGDWKKAHDKLKRGGLEMNMPDGICIRNAATHVGYAKHERYDMSRVLTQYFFEMMLISCEEKNVRDAQTLNNLLNTYRYGLLNSIFSSYTDSSNTLLWNVLRRLGDFLSDFGLRSHLNKINEYQQSLTEHVDLPDHVRITQPVPANSYAATHAFGSYVSQASAGSKPEEPAGLQRLREDAQLRRNIDSQRNSTSQSRGTYTTSNNAYGSFYFKSN
jgi:hypothetical protein